MRSRCPLKIPRQSHIILTVIVGGPVRTALEESTKASRLPSGLHCTSVIEPPIQQSTP